MIGFGRSYVDVGSCDVFFRTRVLYVYGLGYTGLDRAWIWAAAGQEKKLRGQKYPSEIRLGGSTGAGLHGEEKARHDRRSCPEIFKHCC